MDQTRRDAPDDGSDQDREEYVGSFEADLGQLEGDVPGPINPPQGCRFHTRCPHRMAVCSEREPVLRDLGAGQLVACFLHGE